MLFWLVDCHAAGEFGLLTATLRPLGPLLLKFSHGSIFQFQLLLPCREEANEEEAREGERHNEYNGYGFTELIDKGCADRENFRNEQYYINSSRLLLKWKYLLILKNGQGQAAVASLACER